MKVKNTFLGILLLIFCSNNIFCQEDINTLWTKAQTAVENNNIDLATDLLKQIVNDVPHNHHLFAKSNIILANIYGYDENTIEMEKAIKALEAYPDLQDELKVELEKARHFYNAIIKKKVPFEEDLCGIWVSDFSTDKQGLPFVVLKISKNYRNEYSATILPQKRPKFYQTIEI